MINKAVFTKNMANKTIHVVREFAAPVNKVWQAWTDSTILDKWWAPKPWKAETITMNFTEGGTWLYCMAGPNGEKHYSRVDFKTIAAPKSFSALSSFSDAEGNIGSNFPASHWLNQFSSTATGSKVEVTLTFDKEEDMKMLIDMGFEGGFTMGLNNLDEVLA